MLKCCDKNGSILIKKGYAYRIMCSFIKASLPISYKNQSESQKISFWLEELINRSGYKENGIPSTQAKIQLSAQGQTSEEKGLEEAIKDRADKAEKNRQAVEDMVSNSNRILLRISSIFPWDIFPSTVILEETRLTIIHRQLFSSQVHSIDIKNISNIFIDTGILSAQLTIVSATFAQNQIIIKRLWKNDAILMRRIIEGLRMFVEKEVDTTSYKVEELRDKLKALSTRGIIL